MLVSSWEDVGWLVRVRVLVLVLVLVLDCRISWCKIYLSSI